MPNYREEAKKWLFDHYAPNRIATMSPQRDAVMEFATYLQSLEQEKQKDCLACLREYKGWDRDGIPHDCKTKRPEKPKEVEELFWDDLSNRPIGHTYEEGYLLNINHNLVLIGKLIHNALLKKI